MNIYLIYFRFDCCKYMKQKVTSLGKCWELDLQNLAPEWMRKQISPGSESGLQMIVDAQLEEELRGEDGDANAIFSDIYENGFRYYIHPPGANAELTSEGISVSPSRTVYSAIKTISVSSLSQNNNKDDSITAQPIESKKLGKLFRTLA